MPFIITIDSGSNGLISKPDQVRISLLIDVLQSQYCQTCHWSVLGPISQPVYEIMIEIF